MTERRVSRDHLNSAADVLEAHFEVIFVSYEERLRAIESPLIADAATREQLRAQARAVLEDVATNLRGQEEQSGARNNGDPLSESIGVSRAREGVHPGESLRAAAALSEAALSIVVDNLPPSPLSRSQVAAIALAIQKSILERVARASVTYGKYLIGKLHEAHADERQRISRELHDRVAHSIMVAFRNLELYEIYQEQDPSRAGRKFELAKSTVQVALESIRTLSRELRNSSAEEGLEVALSDYLRPIASPEIEAGVSAEGDESFIAPEIRDELFLVLREAIRNAVAHSEARRINVELHTTPYGVRATVEDDGRGFEPEESAASSGGTGLISMKERMLLLGGTFSLASGSGNGARVEIFVPLPRSGR